MRILIVTSDDSLGRELAARFAPVPSDLCGDFRSARAKLASGTYDLILTELRLGEFNGLHLAYIAKHQQPGARTVVFTAPFDAAFASEAVAAGAFYEHTQRIVASACAYLNAVTADGGGQEKRLEPGPFGAELDENDGLDQLRPH